MLTRFRNPLQNKLGKIYREARSRAGDLTAFILTLKGVYQVPMKTVGGYLAIFTAIVPSIYFFKGLKEQAAASPQNANQAPPQQPAPTSTAQVQMQLQIPRPPSNLMLFTMWVVKYLDCSAAFMGQFGTHHMEMMIASATLGVEFVNYDSPTDAKNFVMFFYMLQALYHSGHVFLERKASYERFPPPREQVNERRVDVKEQEPRALPVAAEAKVAEDRKGNSDNVAVRISENNQNNLVSSDESFVRFHFS